MGRPATNVSWEIMQQEYYNPDLPPTPFPSPAPLTPTRAKRSPRKNARSLQPTPQNPGPPAAPPMTNPPSQVTGAASHQTPRPPPNGAGVPAPGHTVTPRSSPNVATIPPLAPVPAPAAAPVPALPRAPAVPSSSSIPTPSQTLHTSSPAAIQHTATTAPPPAAARRDGRS
ncbi:hypothetical protein M427DRAFT_235162 [Gonapodya prolifera JEL478]|uniref:Uncharacterized protein n=1 Tax=Gonapodya prolifera (strain JEL478) TaxID=1344416 RepID=A0A139AMH8_GONPJ|nr:hypothetical protein M427DRAFT_235162 [Gonapodya prolifera JEL478]|eukprot:KXS17908.1 hypothetical protein M427DRAFT_235162 [Gonapodya prolifera JEL478]